MAILNTVTMNDYDMAYGDYITKTKDMFNSTAAGLIPINELTGNYTITVGDCFVAANSTAIVALKLPVSTPVGKYFIISSLGVTVTVDGNGSSISGANVLTISPATTSQLVKGSSAFVAY